MGQLADMHRRIAKIRRILEENKIFMEFFSMICIAVMGIAVSYSANKIAERQTELIELQMEVEYSPEFVLADYDIDSRRAVWVRNYLTGDAQKKNYNDLNPFEDFSRGLLEDYEFYLAYHYVSDWEIVDRYLQGDDSVDLSEAVRIREKFSEDFTQANSRFSFYNNGSHITDVSIQPFVLCQVNTMDPQLRPVEFIISDFFDRPPDYNSNQGVFDLYCSDQEWLYGVFKNFERLLDPDPRYYFEVEWQRCFWISYVTSAGNRMSEFYSFDMLELKKIEEPQVVIKDGEGPVCYDNYLQFLDHTFQTNDLYDENCILFSLIKGRK